MMNPLPPPVSTLRLSPEVNPASTTHTVRLSRQPARSAFTCASTVVSAVSPGHTHSLTGSPPVVTAMPITTWGRSGRESFEWPRWRNPTPVPSSSPSSNSISK
jgi:hypothetical protein